MTVTTRTHTGTARYPPGLARLGTPFLSSAAFRGGTVGSDLLLSPDKKKYRGRKGDRQRFEKFGHGETLTGLKNG